MLLLCLFINGISLPRASGKGLTTLMCVIYCEPVATSACQPTFGTHIYSTTTLFQKKWLKEKLHRKFIHRQTGIQQRSTAHITVGAKEAKIPQTCNIAYCLLFIALITAETEVPERYRCQPISHPTSTVVNNLHR